MVRCRAAAVVAAAALAGGCNLVLGLEPADHTDALVDARAIDAGSDGELGAWSTPVSIAAYSTSNVEQDPVMSRDGLELYVAYAAPASPTMVDIVLSRRVATNQPWPAPIKVNELSTTMNEMTPRLTGEDRVMYLASDRTGTTGSTDIFRSQRSSQVAAWATPIPVTDTAINSMASDRTASPCLGATRFVFVSERAGQPDLYEWVNGIATAISSASSSAFIETGAFVTEDCLTVYFAANLAGNSDLYVMTRPSIDAEFPPAVRIDELSTSGFEESDPWVSSDGRHILFSSNQNGTSDLWEAFR